MRILGIDPGLATCGFALIEATSSTDIRILDLDLWVTRAELTMRDRLAELRDDVRPYLAANTPASVVAEIPTHMRDATAASMLWAAYATLGALAECQGATWCEISTHSWRSALDLPQERSGAPRAPKGVKLSEDQEKALRREQARCSAQAKARRKRGTKDLMLDRFPGVPTLLRGLDAKLREHPLDALAIACAWVEICTRKPAPPAQGELRI